MAISMIGLLALVAVYAIFLFWYGGRTSPVSTAEVQAFLGLVRQQGLDRDDPELYASLEKLLAQDDGREFLMLNLIHYRDKAAYPPGMNFGDSAVAADRRYARAFIEPANVEHWHVVAMIRYRSRRDFIRSVSAVVDKQIMVHKWAAIETTHVFPVRPILSFITIRLVVATLLAIVALVAWNL
ncbi:MAG: hypothetical protein EBT81_06100 [Gammaproteobacteria bacterium]|nr:hypothetical protein [Gammaproteobacteria bacterium]